MHFEHADIYLTYFAKVTKAVDNMYATAAIFDGLIAKIVMDG